MKNVKTDNACFVAMILGDGGYSQPKVIDAKTVEEPGYSFEEHQKNRERLIQEYTGVDSRDKDRWIELDKKVAQHLGIMPSGFTKKAYDAALYLGINMYDSGLRKKLGDLREENASLRKDIGARIIELEGRDNDGLMYKLSEAKTELREQAHTYRGGQSLLKSYSKKLEEIDDELADLKYRPNTNRQKSLESEKRRVQEEKEKTEEAQEDVSLAIQSKHSKVQQLSLEAGRLKTELRVSKRNLSWNESAVAMLGGYFDKREGMMRSKELYQAIGQMQYHRGEMNEALEEADEFFSREMQELSALGGDCYVHEPRLKEKMEAINKKDREKMGYDVERILREIRL